MCAEKAGGRVWERRGGGLVWSRGFKYMYHVIQNWLIFCSILMAI